MIQCTNIHLYLFIWWRYAFDHLFFLLTLILGVKLKNDIDWHQKDNVQCKHKTLLNNTLSMPSF